MSNPIPTYPPCRMSLEKLLKRNSTVGRAITERFPDFKNKVEHFDMESFNNFRDKVAKVFEQIGYNPQSELDSTPLDQLFLIKPEPSTFIRWLGCAGTWVDSIECGLLSQIDSIQSRICTTLLHRGAISYDLMHKPYLFNSSRAQSGPFGYFDEKEVVKLVVDFEPENYADLKRQIGARVIFHRNTHVASSTDLDYFITRGYKYDFNIDREDVKLLNGPSSTCMDYEEFNLQKYADEINPRVPLVGDTCFQNCVLKNVIHKYNCWPLSMPYFRNDSLDPGRKLKSCSWFRESHHASLQKRLESVRVGMLTGKKAQPSRATKTGPIKDEMRAYTQIRRHCWTQCTLACHLTQYTVTVTRSVWPLDVQLLFDDSAYYARLRHCCALITLKYSHFHYNVQQYVPKYNLIDTIGNLGGLLAVWLGLSIVSIYKAVQKLVEFCNRRPLSRIQPRQSAIRTFRYG